MKTIIHYTPIVFILYFNQYTFGFDCASENWGFENNNLQNWTTNGYVSLTSPGSIDPYGAYPWVYPDGGGHSLKISGDQNAQANGSAERTITVPPTGTTYLTFHFAMSIFNYPHAASDAAKFYVEFYDQAGNLIACPYYECYYSYNMGAVGVNNFQTTANNASFYNPNANGDGPDMHPVSYTPWNDITLDLSGYAGTNLTIKFKVDWCVFGPDWSYALIDVECPKNNAEPKEICAYEYPFNLCAPANMATYQWKDADGNAIDNTQCIDIIQAGQYYCDVLPAGIQCSAGSIVTYEYILPEVPLLDFTAIDHCLNETMTIANHSLYPDGVQCTTNWSMGDGIGTTTSIQPVYTYGAFGNYNITLTVNTINGCQVELIQPVEVLPLPELDFTSPNPEGCTQWCVDFENKSNIAYGNISQFIWDLDDGINTQEENPRWCYHNPSLETEYKTIKLTGISNFGCTSTIEKPNFVTVFPKPIAEFSHTPKPADLYHSTVHFKNESKIGSLFHWNFAALGSSEEENPQFSFSSDYAGVYDVCLEVTSVHNCFHSICKPIEVKGIANVFVANSFSPDNDGLNDSFGPKMFGISTEDYAFRVFNRWGDLIYQSLNPNNSAWDGKYQGKEAIFDVYQWTLNCKSQFDSDEKFNQSGMVTLLK